MLSGAYQNSSCSCIQKESTRKVCKELFWINYRATNFTNYKNPSPRMFEKLNKIREHDPTVTVFFVI